MSSADAPSPYAPPAQPPVLAPSRPSPFVAVVLSLIFGWGAGHVYAGRARRGLVWGAAPLVVVVTTLGAMRMAPSGGALFLALAIAVVAYLAAMIDAGRAAARSEVRGGVGPIVLAAIGFLVLGRGAAYLTRCAVLEAFNVPAGSMMPTIFAGDHIFVDKTRTSPRRGDVVVFPFPEHPEQDFVKRVVGMPGDSLEFDEGHPIVNGVRVPSCRVGAWSYDDEGTTHQGELFVESLEGRPHLAFYDATFAAMPERQGPYKVKEGEAFMIGDNRNNSHDSRMWFGGVGGGVPIASVRGTAFVVWLSFGEKNPDGLRAWQGIDGVHLPQSAAGLRDALGKCLGELQVK